eukprot:341495_1
MAYTSHIALLHSTIGEIYNNEYIDENYNYSSSVNATKLDMDDINNNNNICVSSNGDSILEIPQNYSEYHSGKILDCVIATINSKFLNNNSMSDLVIADLYKGDFIYNISDEEWLKRLEYYVSICKPYFITIPITLSSKYKLTDTAQGKFILNGNNIFPHCEYLQLNGLFNDNGCFVYDYTNESVICACSHLTSFRINSDEFNPEANTLKVWHFKQLTISNLIKYPTIWIVMLIIMLILILACFIRNNRIHDKPMLAFDDIIYKEFRDEKCIKAQQGQELKTISKYLGKLSIDSNSNSNNNNNEQDNIISKNKCFIYMKLSFNLWKIYLKNDHTV